METSEINELKIEMKTGKEDKFINILKGLLGDLFNFNQTDEYGNTLLHFACRERKYNVVIFLLDNGANPSITNMDGRLPIHLATIYSSSRELSMLSSNINNNINNSTKIINKLLQVYPLSLSVKDNDGLTPLDYYAIHSQIIEINIISRICKLFNCNTVNKDILEKIEIYLLLKKNKIAYQKNNILKK